MTHDEQDIRIGCNISRIRHADLGLCLIIVGDEEQVKAERLESFNRLFDRKLRA
jgi:hypothetical protein